VGPINRYNLEEVRALWMKMAQIAAGMLHGRIGIIEGSRSLHALQHSLPEIELDPDFTVFDAIVSETDHLPIGQERALWSKTALLEKDNEISLAEKHYKDKILQACQNIIQRKNKIE